MRRDLHTKGIVLIEEEAQEISDFIDHALEVQLDRHTDNYICSDKLEDGKRRMDPNGPECIRSSSASGRTPQKGISLMEHNEIANGWLKKLKPVVKNVDEEQLRGKLRSITSVSDVYTDKTSPLKVGDQCIWLTMFEVDDIGRCIFRAPSELSIENSLVVVVELLPEDVAGRAQFAVQRVSDGRYIRGLYRSALALKA
jgi:hypothetical protein